MSRSVPEWIGKTDNSMPSKAVRLRIYTRQKGVCACGCTQIMDLNRPNSIHCDHIVPLIYEGENRESNLQLLLAECHKNKTKAEASQRAEARRHHAQAFTRPPSKWQTQGFAKADPQRRATSPLAEKFPGDILSRNIR